MLKVKRESERKVTGKRCVAANCSSTHKDCVSLHFFPKEQLIRRQWIDFVKVKRAKWNGPTEYSCLCSKHFTMECFPFRHRFELENMQRAPKRVILNDDAVPTIHCTPSNDTECCNDRCGEESQTHSASPPKKLRKGYRKREVCRIIAEYTKNVENAIDEINEETQTQLLTLDNPLELEHENQNSVGIQVNFSPERVSKKCQTRKYSKKLEKPAMVSKGTQTEKLEFQLKKDAFQMVRPEYLDCDANASNKKPTKLDHKTFSNLYEDSTLKDDTEMPSPLNEETRDPSYEPSDSESEDSEFEVVKGCQNNEEKYIVFKSKIMELFERCSKCNEVTNSKMLHIYKTGSSIRIQQNCEHCLFKRCWTSQPYIGNIPAGNLTISAGILYAGLIPSKILRMFKFMQITCICISTFMNHQHSFLYPSISNIWENHQNCYFQRVREQNRTVVLAGDGRADTPGHSAKYGSYSMLDLEEGAIIDIQLVQSNEVQSSCHMEKEGLIRSIQFLHQNDVHLQCLITDRHVQIVKWVRENLEGTKHFYDVWHVAKGLKKKLFALSKEKDCSELSCWIKSLVNHFYWTVATSSHNQKGEEINEKWLSVLNHITNVYSGHGELFRSCLHGELTGKERKKKWLSPGTKVFEKLTDIINSRQIKKDLVMLSPEYQTSALEGFHSVVNHFAPKMIGFSYPGMVCRLRLAALHFNENTNRPQAKTKGGKERYSVEFPKYKRGEHTIKKVLVESTYDYVEHLLLKTFHLAEESGLNMNANLSTINSPPPLCSKYLKPDKNLAIQQHKSRFSQGFESP